MKIIYYLFNIFNLLLFVILISLSTLNSFIILNNHNPILISRPYKTEKNIKVTIQFKFQNNSEALSNNKAIAITFYNKDFSTYSNKILDLINDYSNIDLSDYSIIDTNTYNEYKQSLDNICIFKNLNSNIVIKTIDITYNNDSIICLLESDFSILLNEDYELSILLKNKSISSNVLSGVRLFTTTYNKVIIKNYLNSQDKIYSSDNMFSKENSFFNKNIILNDVYNLGSLVFYDNYSARKDFEITTIIQTLDNATCSNGKCNNIYIGDKLKIEIFLRVQTFIKNIDHYYVIELPEIIELIEGNNINIVSKSYEGSDQLIDRAIKSNIDNDINKKSYKYQEHNSYYLGDGKYLINTIDSDLEPQRRFELILSNIRIKSNINFNSNKKHYLNLVVYMSNSNIIKNFYKQEIQISQIKIDFPKNINNSSGIFNPDNYDLYETGSFPVQFNFQINSDIPEGGVIKIQHTNPLKDSTIINFIASTCDFSNFDLSTSNKQRFESDNNVFNSFDTFGNRPYCYNINSELNLPIKDGKEEKELGSGIFFKINTKLTKNKIYNFSVWIYVDMCLKHLNNKARITFDSNNYKIMNKYYSKLKFSYEIYSKVDNISKLSIKSNTDLFLNKSIFKPENKIAQSDNIEMDNKCIIANTLHNEALYFKQDTSSSGFYDYNLNDSNYYVKLSNLENIRNIIYKEMHDFSFIKTNNFSNCELKKESCPFYNVFDNNNIQEGYLKKESNINNINNNDNSIKKGNFLALKINLYPSNNQRLFEEFPLPYLKYDFNLNRSMYYSNTNKNSYSKDDIHNFLYYNDLVELYNQHESLKDDKELLDSTNVYSRVKPSFFFIKGRLRFEIPKKWFNISENINSCYLSWANYLDNKEDQTDLKYLLPTTSIKNKTNNYIKYGESISESNSNLSKSNYYNIVNLNNNTLNNKNLFNPLSIESELIENNESIDYFNQAINYPLNKSSEDAILDESANKILQENININKNLSSLYYLSTCIKTSNSIEETTFKSIYTHFDIRIIWITRLSNNSKKLKLLNESELTKHFPNEIHSIKEKTSTNDRLDYNIYDIPTRIARLIKLYPEPTLFQSKENFVNANNKINNIYSFRVSYNQFGICLIQINSNDLMLMSNSSNNTIVIWLFGATLLETDYNSVSNQYPILTNNNNNFKNDVKVFGFNSSIPFYTSPYYYNKSKANTTNDFNDLIINYDAYKIKPNYCYGRLCDLKGYNSFYSNYNIKNNDTSYLQFMSSYILIHYNSNNGLFNDIDKNEEIDFNNAKSNIEFDNLIYIPYTCPIIKQIEQKPKAHDYIKYYRGPVVFIAGFKTIYHTKSINLDNKQDNLNNIIFENISYSNINSILTYRENNNEINSNNTKNNNTVIFSYIFKSNSQTIYKYYNYDFKNNNNIISKSSVSLNWNITDKSNNNLYISEYPNDVFTTQENKSLILYNILLINKDYNLSVDDVSFYINDQVVLMHKSKDKDNNNNNNISFIFNNYCYSKIILNKVNIDSQLINKVLKNDVKNISMLYKNISMPIISGTDSSYFKKLLNSFVFISLFDYTDYPNYFERYKLDNSDDNDEYIEQYNDLNNSYSFNNRDKIAYISNLIEYNPFVTGPNSFNSPRNYNSLVKFTNNNNQKTIDKVSIFISNNEYNLQLDNYGSFKLSIILPSPINSHSIIKLKSIVFNSEKNSFIQCGIQSLSNYLYNCSLSPNNESNTLNCNLNHNVKSYNEQVNICCFNSKFSLFNEIEFNDIGLEIEIKSDNEVNSNEYYNIKDKITEINNTDNINIKSYELFTIYSNNLIPTSILDVNDPNKNEINNSSFKEFEIKQVLFNHINQINAFGDITLLLNLNRSPLRNSFIDLKMKLSPIKNVAPRCNIYFTDTKLVNNKKNNIANFSKLHFDRGDFLIDSCEIIDYKIEDNTEKQYTIRISFNTDNYKCNLDLSNELVISINPVILINYKQEKYSLYWELKYYLLNNLYTKNFPTDKINKTVANAIDKSFKSIINIDTNLNKYSINLNKDNLCNIKANGPLIQNEYGIYSVEYNINDIISSLDELNKNYNIIPNELSIYYDYYLYGSNYEDIKCYYLDSYANKNFTPFNSIHKYLIENNYVFYYRINCTFNDGIINANFKNLFNYSFDNNMYLNNNKIYITGLPILLNSNVKYLCSINYLSNNTRIAIASGNGYLEANSIFIKNKNISINTFYLGSSYEDYDNKNLFSKDTPIYEDKKYISRIISNVYIRLSIDNLLLNLPKICDKLYFYIKIPKEYNISLYNNMYYLNSKVGNSVISDLINSFTLEDNSLSYKYIYSNNISKFIEIIEYEAYKDGTTKAGNIIEIDLASILIIGDYVMFSLKKPYTFNYKFRYFKITLYDLYTPSGLVSEFEVFAYDDSCFFKTFKNANTFKGNLKLININDSNNIDNQKYINNELISYSSITNYSKSYYYKNYSEKIYFNIKIDENHIKEFNNNKINSNDINTIYLIPGKYINYKLYILNNILVESHYNFEEELIVYINSLTDTNSYFVNNLTNIKNVELIELKTIPDKIVLDTYKKNLSITKNNIYKEFSFKIGVKCNTFPTLFYSNITNKNYKENNDLDNLISNSIYSNLIGITTYVINNHNINYFSVFTDNDIKNKLDEMSIVNLHANSIKILYIASDDIPVDLIDIEIKEDTKSSNSSIIIEKYTYDNDFNNYQLFDKTKNKFIIPIYVKTYKNIKGEAVFSIAIKSNNYHNCFKLDIDKINFKVEDSINELDTNINTNNIFNVKESFKDINNIYTYTTINIKVNPTTYPLFLFCELRCSNSKYSLDKDFYNFKKYFTNGYEANKYEYFKFLPINNLNEVDVKFNNLSRETSYKLKCHITTIDSNLDNLKILKYEKDNINTFKKMERICYAFKIKSYVFLNQTPLLSTAVEDILLYQCQKLFNKMNNKCLICLNKENKGAYGYKYNKNNTCNSYEEKKFENNSILSDTIHYEVKDKNENNNKDILNENGNYVITICLSQDYDCNYNVDSEDIKDIKNNFDLYKKNVNKLKIFKHNELERINEESISFVNSVFNKYEKKYEIIDFREIDDSKDILLPMLDIKNFDRSKDNSYYFLNISYITYLKCYMMQDNYKELNDIIIPTYDDIINCKRTNNLINTNCKDILINPEGSQIKIDNQFNVNGFNIVWMFCEYYVPQSKKRSSILKIIEEYKKLNHINEDNTTNNSTDTTNKNIKCINSLWNNCFFSILNISEYLILLYCLIIH